MAGAGGGNGGRAVLKSQIKEVSDRLDLLEGRVDRVETTLELSEAYRRLRCERSPGLNTLWGQFENKTFEAKDLKSKVCTVIEQEVQAALRQECDETSLQNTSAQLSNNRRSIPPLEVRKRLADNFTLSPYLEWVSKDKAGGFQLILSRGEPTRLFTKTVSQDLNWALFVLSRKTEGEIQGIQLYMDRGPKARAKGRNKGHPKGKGGKGGKGKGKGRGKGPGNGGDAQRMDTD